MNVFQLHTNIMDDYKAYINSFVNIQDEKITARVTQEIEKGKLWPEPLIQFNPSFTKGNTPQELVVAKQIHPALSQVFLDRPLHKHQVEALQQGTRGNNFVVVSGTGSGKSLTYIATILNSLFKRSDSHTLVGVSAVVVYPMNALINSQYIEFEKYAKNYKANTGYDFPFSLRKHTGQESSEYKKETIDNPPHILLTNYVMLELILTRHGEERLRNSIFGSLEFLVFDELHTYRGRQGADVGLLVRKLKAQCRNSNLVSIGTSATMASGATWQEQQLTIASVATDFFATSFQPEQVIGEYLEKVTSSEPDKIKLVQAIDSPVGFATVEELLANPISIWLETYAVLDRKGDRYFRAKPRTLAEMAQALAAFTGLEYPVCHVALINFLEKLAQFNQKLADAEQKSLFPFKIHQFINQTGAVYATLENHTDRQIELDAIARTSKETGEKPFFQLAFSRVTGVDLYCVLRQDSISRFIPRPFNKYVEDDQLANAGYLVLQKIGDEPFWDEQRDIENLPENWIRYDKYDNPLIKKEYHSRLPQSVCVNAYGEINNTPKADTQDAWFIPYDANIDFTSFTVYDSRTKEGTMYSSLGIEGRSTATNVLVFGMLQRMKQAGLESKVQKVLSFTDNRQDTALQSGHFNDYIKTGQLRSAIWRAVNKNGSLDYTKVLDATFESLRLNVEEYVIQLADTGTYKYDENLRAIKAALYYKIIQDLRRGWRVILPNLEQCGLLQIQYRTLEQEVVRDKWQRHPILGQLSPPQLQELFFQLLDYFRKSNAIHLDALTLPEIEKSLKLFRENLKPSWLYSPSEEVLYPSHIRIFPATRKKHKLFTISTGSRSAPGRFVKNWLHTHLNGFQFTNAADFEKLMEWLLDELALSGFLYKDDRTLDVPLYQINGTHILWQKGDEVSSILDKVKNPSFLSLPRKINQYFQKFYKTDFAGGRPIRSGEHSGQLNNEQRILFEEDFRKGNINLLCCSPTMELGIDISDLMAVHMRNVPPDPANYAQRSGRAGRSGQAALVFTFCAAMSAHDQHYFNKRIDMVAGIVQAPKLDYNNEELLRGHLYSLYLAEAGINNLDIDLAKLVDEIPNSPSFLELSPEILEKLALQPEKLKKLAIIFTKAAADIAQKEGPKEWLNEAWIQAQLGNCITRFNESLNRWRTLYKNALALIQKCTLIENDVTIPTSDERKKTAGRERRMAQKEIDLLRNIPAPNKKTNDQSEFYPYRYLAAEGFLPGFNFTRLPVRIFIPHQDGQYISRPRSVAIKEFGPRNSLYYMGSKFMAGSMPVNDLNNQLGRAKISLATGYILTAQNGDYDQNMDPFAQIELSNDNNRQLVHNLIPLNECRAIESGRITCEEEERMREGFQIDTFFSMKNNLSKIKKLKATLAGEELLEITYLPAASLYKLNRKWRTVNESGFYIEETSGIWKKPGALNNTANQANTIPLINVQLFTEYTADAIYIKPLKNLGLQHQQSGAISLLYALKRGIENIFQAEPREIGAEIMGKADEPNIMIYEAAEGSLGILKQIIKEPGKFKEIAKEAYNVCHFNKTQEEQESYGTASYHDLLSYFNQQYHQEINRIHIKEALENLSKADYQLPPEQQFSSYQQQYEQLLSQADAASSTETALLNYLYKHQLRLPDKAQYDLRPKGCNTIPDFLYHTEVQACIFCDGSHHDAPAIQQLDTQKRACVENLGYEVVVWHYKTPLNELVNSYPHIFSKIST